MKIKILVSIGSNIFYHKGFSSQTMRDTKKSYDKKFIETDLQT